MFEKCFFRKTIKIILGLAIFISSLILLTLYKEIITRPSYSLKLISVQKDERRILTGNRANPRCEIPVIEPLNSVVKPFITYDRSPKNNECKIPKKKTYIENDRLIVNLKSIQHFEVCYIQRIDDFTIDDKSSCEIFQLSKDEVTTKEPEERCYRESRVNQIIYIWDNKDNIVVANDERMCTQDMKFIYEDKKMVHNLTQRCFMPAGKDVGSNIILSPACNESSEFEFQHGIFKHIESSFCIGYTSKNGKLVLADCRKASKFHYDGLKSYDINIKIPIKHEFIKIQYLQNSTSIEEFHAHIFTPTETPDARSKDQLDIIMIMIDSTSNANAQRHLTKTYRYLQNNPNTFIFKGHTINGDGTMAQLCAMLTGVAEKDAPEARRSIPNAKSVDSWPFIFKDFHQKNYKTVYIEDDPIWGTFQFRLNGWIKQPTTHYLRTYFYALAEQLEGQSMICEPEITLEYFKRYMNVYKKYKKYALTNFGRLQHNDMNNLMLVDEHMFEFFEFLKENGHLENSAVFLFGDHGMRMGGYRGTREGKIEERLPLMSLTLPNSFIKRYPSLIRNMRTNTETLTTHYDIYRTLKHLLHFPNDNTNISFARSLFDDIKRLDRNCQEANIDSHWCPCETFEKVSINDANVIKIAEEAVIIINKKLEDVPIAFNKCNKLTLSNITRAGKKSLDKSVQGFVFAHRENNCESCGVRVDENIPLKSSYEIVFTVHPSDAQFEISADITTVNNRIVKIKIQPEMSRTNRYGNQPACVAEQFPHLREFCSCK